MITRIDVDEDILSEKTEIGLSTVTVYGNIEDINRVADYARHMYDMHTAITDNPHADKIGQKYDSCVASAADNPSTNKTTTSSMVYQPNHYRSNGIETIEKIDAVIDGLPAKQASALANVLKYFDRAGLKDDAEQDLKKANNYAHRLVTGKWRKDN